DWHERPRRFGDLDPARVDTRDTPIRAGTGHSTRDGVEAQGDEGPTAIDDLFRGRPLVPGIDTRHRDQADFLVHPSTPRVQGETSGEWVAPGRAAGPGLISCSPPPPPRSGGNGGGVGRAGPFPRSRARPPDAPPILHHSRGVLR